MFIAVYGTLRKGCKANSLLADSQFYLTAALDGYEMYTDNEAFPFVVKTTRPSEQIVVDIYYISTSTRRRLDAYEGEGSLYIRDSIADWCAKALVLRLGESARDLTDYIKGMIGGEPTIYIYEAGVGLRSSVVNKSARKIDGGDWISDVQERKKKDGYDWG